MMKLFDIQNNSKLSIINMYREQLQTFKKLGIGQRTHFGTVVTDKLIDTTKKRLTQLSATYEASLTPNAMKWRIKRDECQPTGL